MISFFSERILLTGDERFGALEDVSTRPGPPVKRQQFIAPLLYQVASNGHPKGLSGCMDVSAGQNESHPAKVGYDGGEGFDAVSGWGVPQWGEAADDLVGGLPEREPSRLLRDRQPQLAPPWVGSNLLLLAFCGHMFRDQFRLRSAD
jgi:hypothetical protein